MRTRNCFCVVALSAALIASLIAPDANLSAAEVNDASGPRNMVTHELSVGGISRVGARDPALIGGGNGGTGTSVNFDDGNLNYGRGLASFGVQGKTKIAADSARIEVGIEAVYFYDFLNADGKTDFRVLSKEARDRTGRNVYLNDAFVGLKGSIDDAALNVRLGNQRLRWSDSPSFGQSIAPVNPVSGSRRYQPANTAADAVVAVPMLFGQITSDANWTLSGFYQFGFEPTEPEAAGTFLSANDYYSPGARFLQLGDGSPRVPDTDASVITAATPLGSQVRRGADRRPGLAGQFGLRIETPEFGGAKLAFTGYAMRVHSREPIVSVHTGTLGGLLGVTALDYTSSGSYFVEYPENVRIVGLSARLKPAPYTLLALNYSMRIGQPLQIDDNILITAGLAPGAAVGACAANPASARCTATLAVLNRNPIIAASGGITATNAGTFFQTEISGYERFNVSQYAVSVGQGLPPILGARRWVATAEAGGIYLHGFKPGWLDASVTSRPDDTGTRRIGFAARSAWGYRATTKIEYTNVLGLQNLAPSVTWIHDVHGNAPITLGTLLAGNKSTILAIDASIDKSLSARISYRSYLGKGNDADRLTDRDFVSLALSRKF